jgi:hypothetical protein
MRKIDCAHSQSVKTFVSPLKSEKYVFLPIFSHLLTLNIFFEFFADFSKVFTLRKCAQSIFRKKLPLNMLFKTFFPIFDPGVTGPQ